MTRDPRASHRNLIYKATASVAEQRRWIETHGRDLPGYIARYGDSNAPAADRYGDGGQLVYKADMDELAARESALELLTGRKAWKYYDTVETITVELAYDRPDDSIEPAYNEEDGVELEDLIAKAVNEFRERHPDATVWINGVG